MDSHYLETLYRQAKTTKCKKSAPCTLSDCECISILNNFLVKKKKNLEALFCYLVLKLALVTISV